ncbi:MAG: CRISPR-associated endonuclease Cas6 [Alkaliphilus sp.]
MTSVKYATLKYMDLEMERRNAPKIRGYFANKYSEIVEFHNHVGEENIYKYPMVQYKIINKTPILLGINEGVDVLKNVAFKEDSVVIEGEKFPIEQIELKVTTQEFGLTNKLIKYRFTTPWMALNQKNIKRYYNADIIEKDELLGRILTGNILSCAKRLKYEVKEQIRVKLNLVEKSAKFKNNSMLVFEGEFYTNFELPNYFGLGKSVARGFGAVVRGR